MPTVSIDVDGYIDLIELRRPTGHGAGDRAAVRNSRLNDVMIVLERQQAELETAMSQHLAGAHALGEELSGVRLEFSEKEPEFHVSVAMRTNGGGVSVGDDRAAAIEKVIATELLEAIQRRAAPSEARQWQPAVTATFRREPTGTGAARRSLWLKALLGLLAVVVLATGYLFLKGYPA